MAQRKKSISLLPHERKVLEDLYLQYRIPRDQYERRPEALANLAEDFNELTGRVECAGELIRYETERHWSNRQPRIKSLAGVSQMGVSHLAVTSVSG